MDQVTAWLMSLDASIRPAVITGGATLFAAVVGFSAVFIQIGRQARNAIKQNKLNEAQKLKLEIYKETLATSREAEDRVQQISSYLRNFSTLVGFARDLERAGYRWQVPEARYPEYLRLYNVGVNSVIKVMTMIESWHIVEPRLEIFSREIAIGHDRLMKVSYASPNVLISAMPVDKFLDQWTLPNDELFSLMRDRVERELYYFGLLSAWVGDFLAEMQELLLGDLFPKHRVKRRDPPDPEQFCIRLDRYDEINKKLNETDWATYAAKIDADARAQFGTAKK